MTVIAMVLAAVAVVLWLPRRTAGEVTVGVPASLPGARVMAAVGAMTAVVILTGLWGTRVGALAAAAAIIAGGATHLIARQLAARRRVARAIAVTDACTALAQELSIGRVPASALSAAAGDFAVLAPAAAIAVGGGDVVARWLDQARDPGAEGLARLARAWRLAEDTGAPLAATLSEVAAALRSERELGHVIAAELATARATGVLLTLLPAAGIGLGFAIGGDPLGFLTRHLVGQGCLVAGAALTICGLIWTDRLATAPTTPEEA